ncbi:hypothetical protein RB614_22090 [Phytohabitans sp. ZYX-F-186]|uniref:HD domain-containing protein n=1 Tax=Phytohabitans maris TaxID=3071409 RepID=A0ABU0ZJQ2_9ACTN|nr:hypothetical protein [Phytohabitans sp. ZYX-F-186]MDQ7907208.1 hypothetical protein [Phytohabitans sp. ZYX-F-186]
MTWVARRLAERQPGVDVERVVRLCLHHDLNRWPFAHNTEVGWFDQAGNTRTFSKSLVDARLSDEDFADIEGVHHKRIDELSAEGRIVLGADAITGVVEDPLLLVTGLNVRPDYIPDAVCRVLGFTLRAEPWRGRVRRLAKEFHGTGTPDPLAFRADFARLFRDLMGRVLERQDRPERLLDVAASVKAHFIRPRVFPVNNELVCRSSWLRGEVMPRYLAHYGDVDLVFVDEDDFVRRAVRIGAAASPADFQPRIDAVRERQPDLCFVGVKTAPAAVRRPRPRLIPAFGSATR